MMRRAALPGLVGFCLTLALGATAPAWAQAPQGAPHRPKVALVLSGGGAMGIAHVGAIQELERIGIRPDLIVGTSMGSVVGGLYASGMNGQQLEEAVHQMNWDAIFDPSPPRDGLTYRQKQQQADFPVKASVGVNRKGLVPPDAIVSDANLLLELRRLLRGRAAVPTFDDLSIPFRAVATDIETGQKVVLDRGELAGAMRASMSVPGVFAPYRINGKLLVDGGMADNVPIDVARDLGADIVIVVATQTPMATGDKMRSVADVLGQTVTMLILANERQQLATLKDTDVLARIDIAALGLGAADFKEGPAFIAAGHKAMREQEEPLRRIAAMRSPDTLVAKATKPPPVIDYVKLENDSKLSDKTLLRDVEQFQGKPLDTDAVVVALQGIYATGIFSRVDYRIEQEGERTGLVVHAEQKSGDANRLRLGLTLAATDQGGNEFNISAELRLLQLDRQGSEARFIGVIGDRQIFSAEYFKVLDSRRRWFIAPMVELQSRPVPTYDSKGFRLNEYDVQYVLGTLAAGRQVRSYEVRAGIQYGTGDASLREGIQTVPDTDLDVGRIFASLGVDTLDNPFFPTKGLRGQLYWQQGFKSLGDDADYQQVSGGLLYSKTFGRHNLIVTGGGGDTYQGSAPLVSLYSLGGAFSFPGFNVEELTGSSYGVVRLIYRYKLTDDSKGLLHLPLYAGASIVTGNTWAHSRDANFNDLRVGGNVYVAADTIIGPVYLAAGIADEGRSAIYLFIGRPF